MFGRRPEDANKATRLINIRRGGHYDVFIGRGSKWGNPFSHKQSTFPGVIHVDTAEEAVRRHKEWILTQPQLLEALGELKNKTLGCFCDEICHGNTLVELVEERCTNQ